MARHVEIYFRCSEKESKAKMGIKKPKLKNARQFVEPDDEEFKLSMKAARRKLEVPMPAAMPCKIPIKSSGDTHRSIGKRKTQDACVVDADESTRPRLEGAIHRSHQDHIAAKGTNSMTHYSLVHIFIPMRQTFKKYRMQRRQWRKNEKIGEILAWQLTK